MSHLKLVQQNHFNTKLDQDDVEELLKGGVGSGRKGHTSPNTKLLQDHLKQIRDRKHFGESTKSGKKITTESHHGTSMGYSPQDHRDAMSFHYERAQGHRNKASQTRNSEERNAHLDIAREHAKHMKGHSAAAGVIEDRQAKTEAAESKKK